MDVTAGAAETRFGAEVVVVGSGIAAVAAALAANAAGKDVLLAADGPALASEVTVALNGEVVGDLGPREEALLDRIARLGGLRDGWVDPPICEMVVDRELAEAGIRLLYYTIPIELVITGEEARGVLVAGKDGFHVIAAGAVVDATAEGVLFRNSDVGFLDPPTLAASRTIYFQFCGDDLTGQPADAAGLAISARATWPGEVCVTAGGEAPGGRDGWADLSRRTRLAVAPLAAELRERVPGLADSVVSHTGHSLLACRGPVLVDSQARHPRLSNVAGAGAWSRPPELCNDFEKLNRAGHEAGLLAAAAAVEPVAVTARLPRATVVEHEVLVVGGGTGGAIAALAAARQGAATGLLEAGWFLGGIGTGGGIHSYYHGVRGGLQDEIDERVRAVSDELGGVAKVRGFSPEAKKIALEQAITEAGVALSYQQTAAEVLLHGTRLRGVVAVEPGRIVHHRARVVVDSTGDGDLAEMAGAPFLLGRDNDNLNHAYSQSCGLLRDGKVAFSNFDAGHVDATDLTDLTRARRHGVGLYWREKGFTADDRLLYLAPLLGLRQSRQIIGEYQLTLADQAAGRSFDDDVAYGSCHYDNHAYDYEHESDEAMFWCWALGFWRRPMKHGVPYRALLPKSVDGLLMGCRALSVSHDAHMLFRMQRDMQRIGEAAGTAAALAARAGVEPRQLSPAELQAALGASGALLVDWQSSQSPESVEALIAQLRQPEPNFAVWKLYQHGQAAVPTLRRELRSDDRDLRWWSAVTLAMLGHSAAEETLLEALVQRDSTRPFNEFARPEQTSVVRRLAPRWIAAIPLLGRLESSTAVPALGEVLATATELDALLGAVQALGRIGDRAAVPMLRRLLERDDLPRSAALQNSLGDAGVIEQDLVWQLHLGVAQALHELGTEAPELVEPYLDDSRAYVRTHAQRVIELIPAARQTTVAEAAEAPPLRAPRARD